ncbi:MAG TPA: hypothetical protein HA254_03730 [Candidatus Diapherotrites archaeon]|uniref:Uncharacterized protein n=1 Tax=Candidatus Iainarchaeum sp. TaxID=3101447 RepID=A0A7J4J032_9ARCH|nr:hypothetical protein [Candidatus Diapherotrites archaeon]
MPRHKEPVPASVKRANWERNRKKPTTTNPTRRRKDFRDAGSFFAAALENDCFEDREHAFSGTSKKRILLGLDGRLVAKQDIPDTEIYSHEVAQRCKSFIFVPIKSGKMPFSLRPHAQRYFEAPSLFALEQYLLGNFLRLSDRDIAFCKRICGRAKKGGIGQEKLQKMVFDAGQELEHIFWIDANGNPHKAVSRNVGRIFPSGYAAKFSTTNSLVFDIDSKTKMLKIGICDV